MRLPVHFNDRLQNNLSRTFRRTMKNQGLTTTIIIAFFAGFALIIGSTACEAPEQPESPTTGPEEAPSQLEEDQRQEAAMDQAAPPSEAAGQPPQMGDGPEDPPQLELGGDDDLAAEGGAPAQQQPPAAPDSLQGEVTDEQLDRFAEAVEATNTLQQEQDLERRLHQADSPQEQQEIQQEFVSQLETEVEETGMSFVEYMSLAQRIEHDPALQQRLAERMQ